MICLVEVIQLRPKSYRHTRLLSGRVVLVEQAASLHAVFHAVCYHCSEIVDRVPIVSIVARMVIDAADISKSLCAGLMRRIGAAVNPWTWICQLADIARWGPVIGQRYHIGAIGGRFTVCEMVLCRPANHISHG